MEYEEQNRKMLEVYHRSKEQRYAFDKVFRGESQDEVLTPRLFLPRSSNLPANNSYDLS